MAKQRFEQIERTAIWEVWQKKCAYTGESIPVNGMHLDHIVAESLENKPEEFLELKKKLNLPDDFNLNSFENILPCTPARNLQKSDTALESAQVYFLALAKDRAPKIRERIEKLKKEQTIGTAETNLKSYLERDVLSVGQVVGTSLDYAQDLIEEGQFDPETLKPLFQKFEQMVSPIKVFSETSLEKSSGSSGYDQRIDTLRDMIAEQSVTANKLLGDLENELPPDTEQRIRFRIKANIGASLLRMGRIEEAAESYLSAYNQAPDYSKAAAFKVLGLALSGAADEAVEFGTESIKGAEEVDVGLSSALYVAAKLSTNKDDPSHLIPIEHFDTIDVVVSRIDYLRCSDNQDWRQLAIQTGEKFANENLAARFAADAVLDELFSEGSSRIYLLTTTDKVLVENAANSLQKVWDNEKSKQGKADLSIAANLCNAYRLLGSNEKAKVIAKEGLNFEPSNQDLQERLLAIALDSKDESLISELLPSAPVTRDLIMGVAVYYSNLEEWGKFLEFAEKITQPVLAGHDLAVYEALSLVARFKVGKETNPANAITEFLKIHNDSAAAMIVLTQLAFQIGDEKTAVALFEAAVDKSTQLSNPEKFMLSNVAIRRGKYAEAVKLLQWVPYDVDGEELRLLSMAYVNTTASKMSINFAREIEKNFGQDAYYLRVAGSIFYNGGFLEDAERILKAAVKLDKTSAQTHIALISTYVRQRKIEAIKNHVKIIDLNELVGSAYQLMGLAQMLIKYGSNENVAEFAYKLASANLNEPSVIQLFTGIFLLNNDKDLVPVTGETVGPNMAVQYQNGQQTDWFVIEGSDSNPDQSQYSIDHPLAQAFLGKKIGEQVFFETRFGAKREFTVLAIKHKYLALLHELMGSFNTKFPTEGGMTQFEIKDNDLGPILDVVKTQSIQRKQIFEMYAQSNTPLALMSEALGTPIIEIAHQMRASGFKLRSCIGTFQERDAAMILARDALGKGLALDTYTVWCAQELGILPLLKKRYNRIVIARSSMDDLSLWQDSFNDNSGPMRSIGYDDGRFINFEVAESEVHKQRKTLADNIGSIQTNCEIKPALVPDDFGVRNPQWLGLFDLKLLDPAFLAEQEEILLVSEDMKYRKMCSETTLCSGVWLQVLLLTLLEDKHVSQEEYSQCVIKLSYLHHTFLTLNANLLKYALVTDKTMRDFNSLSGHIGDEGADYQSHMKVVGEFLNTVPAIKLTELETRKAISVILERGIYMAQRYGKLDEGLYYVESMLSGHFFDHYKNWRIGHFIPENKSHSLVSGERAKNKAERRTRRRMLKERR